MARDITSNTVLLIQSEDADASTTFVDTGAGANCPHSIAVNGNVHHETDQAKFGTSSIYFDGSGDYLQIPDSDDFDLTGDFTLEVQARFPAIVGAARFISKGIVTSVDGDWCWGIGNTWGGGTKLNFAFKRSGNVVDVLSNAISPSLNVFHHFAAVKSGYTFYFFMNGTLVGTTTVSSSAFQASSSVLFVGCRSNGSPGYEPFTGYMEEIAINRSCLWTADFTAPTEVYTPYVPQDYIGFKQRTRTLKRR